jgi:hypothetical protein
MRRWCPTRRRRPGAEGIWAFATLPCSISCSQGRDRGAAAAGRRSSAEDWQVIFEERAGIIEFGGGLPRAEAEAKAFNCGVVEWLNRNPERLPAGRCLDCGGRDHAHDAVPVTTEILADQPISRFFSKYSSRLISPRA